MVLLLCVCVCDVGGSLNDAIKKKEAQGEMFSEVELKNLLLQVSMGLKYIHSLGLVHLDIKPSMSHRPAPVYSTESHPKIGPICFFFVGNIFICQRPSTAGGGESEEDEDGRNSAGVIYKIGISGNVMMDQK